MYFSTWPLGNDTLSYVPKEVKVSLKYPVFNLKKNKIEKAQWFGKQEAWVLQSALYITLVAAISYTMEGIKQISKLSSNSFSSNILHTFTIFKIFHLHSLWWIKSTAQFILMKILWSRYLFYKWGLWGPESKNILKIATSRARSWT